MKFCAVICEYNPFHNGHAYQLNEIREKSGCDKILCLMSGNFTQRGEPAVFGKYTRATHAVLSGADIVLELPAAFAVSPAELFAEGAVHLLSSLPAVTALAFGCESGTKEDFLSAARALLNEDKSFKSALKENLKDGTSYIRARNAALLSTGDVDEALISSPNNILGTEYCRALLSLGSKIEPLPLPRVGGGYADAEIKRNFSSATALRAVLGDESKKARKALKNNLPACVFNDLVRYRPLPYGQIALAALLSSSSEAIASTPDCSEGLENRLKSLAKTNPDYSALLSKAVSKRYTLSRLKRILLENLLKIRLKDVRDYLKSPLYFKVLAVKKAGAEETLAELSGGYPLIARKSDYSLLKKEALACFTTDLFAGDLYNALTGLYENEFQTLFV